MTVTSLRSHVDGLRTSYSDNMQLVNGEIRDLIADLKNVAATLTDDNFRDEIRELGQRVKTRKPANRIVAKYCG